jgi:hypothetical protein
VTINSSVVEQPQPSIDALDESAPVFIQEEVTVEGEEHSGDDSDYDESLEIMRGAFRYFNGSDPNLLGDQHIAAATLFSGRSKDQQMCRIARKSTPRSSTTGSMSGVF